MLVTKYGTFKYLAEGAANVVWAVRPPSFLDAEGDIEQDYVLRLRKDRPHLKSAQESVDDFNKHIKPLFDPSVLLVPRIQRLPAELIDLMNDRLRAIEDEAHAHPRQVGRRGVYLPDANVEPNALLLRDLSPKRADEVLLEFKPKWLVQSPSAPADARRCRNCALREMREARGVASGRGSHEYCPIDLLSASESILEAALRSIWAREEDRVRPFAQEFRDKVQPLLKEIQALQQRFCHVGLGDFQEGHVDLPVAMALRDCSLFLQISAENGGVRIYGIKLADLDLKVMDALKLGKWAETERDLISGGWYTEPPPLE